jgi:tetratricopeptide (TPR) repeat protein
MREYGAYRDVAQRLVARDPQSEKWLLELSYGQGAIGAVLEADGDLLGARTEFESALQIKDRLARRTPTDVERQQALGNGNNRLGVVLDKLGEMDGALQHYEADLAIRRTLTTTFPTNFALKRNLQVALNAVGRAYEDRGDLAAATRLYHEWRDVTAAYAAIDRQNTDWQRDAAVAEAFLATALRLTGQLDEAQQRYRTAVATLRPIAQSSKLPLSLRDVATAELGLGQTFLDRDALDAAAAQAAAVERLLSPIIELRRDRVAMARAAEGRLLAGDVAERRGNVNIARETRESALALVASDAPVIDKRVLAVKARALIALNRIDEARPIVERLIHLGYRHPMLLNVWREKVNPVGQRSDRVSLPLSGETTR